MNLSSSSDVRVRTDALSRRPCRIDGLATDPDEMTLPELQQLLSSDAHYKVTPTRNYGLRDPLDRPEELLFACSCGSQPRVDRGPPPPHAPLKYRPLPAGTETRACHVACPGCGKRAAPSLREWRAVVDWNFAHATGKAHSLEAFPYFNLAGLTRQESLQRLNGIKRDLLLRRALARKQREAGIEVGGRFVARLEAYLGWVNVALRVAVR